MEAVGKIKSASLFLKISGAILILSMAFVWTSFVTAAWGDHKPNPNSDGLTGWGLWRSCSNDEITPSCAKLFGWNLQWYRAVQAFGIMGFLSVNLCFLLAFLLIFMPSCAHGKSPSLWTSVLAFWSALCYLIAICIFAGKFDSSFYKTGDGDLGYGWTLAVVTLLLQIIVGILMILESRNVGAKIMDL